ncbi:hypothetical protein ACJ73_09233 [Blastomyces percursus]|uniref:Uncharacterized protein n=1 Tax=Blastomyces percursus TaxID=1658174 RepID=A0A1J9P9L4_9EURO|nr:hypothetical protein ACJ73_09233 [Blastomyces percursus]
MVSSLIRAWSSPDLSTSSHSFLSPRFFNADDNAADDQSPLGSLTFASTKRKPFIKLHRTRPPGSSKASSSFASRNTSRNTLPPPKHHLPARPPAEVCLSFSANHSAPTPSHIHHRPPNPEHESRYRHPVTPNSPRIVACNTRHPTPPDEPPPLEEGATGPSPSSPSTASLDGGLEEFPRLSVLQNDDNIPIEPAILADGRPWEASELLPSFWQGNSPAIPEVHCLCPEPPLSMFCGAPDPHQGCVEGFDGWNENAQKDRHPHIQACPQLHPSHLSTETDALREGSSSEQSESLKRGAEGLEEQTTKRPRIASTLPTHSFITVRSHFLSLQLDERLQFLSWLFEGALARCTPEFNEGVQSAACLDYHGEIGPTQHGPSKGSTTNTTNTQASVTGSDMIYVDAADAQLDGLPDVSVASSPRPDTPAVAASAVDSPAHASQKQPPTSPRPPRYPRVEVVIPTGLPHSRSANP